MGFEFNFSKTERIPNTFNAHRLLWKSKQDELQTELSEALFKAYFTDGRDVGSIEVLSDIAYEVGMKKEEINNLIDILFMIIKNAKLLIRIFLIM